MLLANFNGKEHLRHRAVSLRQHGFLVAFFSAQLMQSTLYYIACLSVCPSVCHMGESVKTVETVVPSLSFFSAYVHSNLCSRTHHLGTIHTLQTDRQTTDGWTADKGVLVRKTSYFLSYKSMICDFLLTVYAITGCITYRLRDIFALKIAVFVTDFGSWNFFWYTYARIYFVL